MAFLGLWRSRAVPADPSYRRQLMVLILPLGRLFTYSLFWDPTRTRYYWILVSVLPKYASMLCLDLLQLFHVNPNQDSIDNPIPARITFRCRSTYRNRVPDPHPTLLTGSCSDSNSLLSSSAQKLTRPVSTSTDLDLTFSLQQAETELRFKTYGSLAQPHVASVSNRVWMWKIYRSVSRTRDVGSQPDPVFNP